MTDVGDMVSNMSTLLSEHLFLIWSLTIYVIQKTWQIIYFNNFTMGIVAVNYQMLLVYFRKVQNNFRKVEKLQI